MFSKSIAKLVVGAMIVSGGFVGTALPAKAMVVGKCTVEYSVYGSPNPKVIAINKSCVVSGAKIKAVLYYLLSSNSPTTYTAQGAAVGVGAASTASRSNAYFTGWAVVQA